MQKHRFGSYQVEVDENATASWYAKSDGWGCTCGHCRNFLELAKKKEMPVLVLKSLAKLDIPPEKATYVSELYTDKTGVHYQFSYRIVGQITGRSDKCEDQKDMRCCHDPYPYGAPNFPEPHFDLEFYAVLPWILEETQNGRSKV